MKPKAAAVEAAAAHFNELIEELDATKWQHGKQVEGRQEADAMLLLLLVVLVLVLLLLLQESYFERN